jgi:mRNA-degrading endonuclease HigB of HigAB toxin-antitoxin module
MKEKQLEFNLKGISNQKEFDEKRKKDMKQISSDAKKKLVDLLTVIINQERCTPSELKKIISLSKWIND